MRILTVESEKDRILNELFKNESTYGDKYKDHLLEQYKLYIEMADKISERRATANSFFLSLNSFLLTVLGILPQLKSNIIEFTVLWIIIVSIAGTSFCISWIMIIRAYKSLNGAKFKIINKIEDNLPVSMYNSEWKYLKTVKKNLKYLPFPIKYSPLSVIELWVPIIIILLYISLAVGGILVSLGIINIPFTGFSEVNDINSYNYS